MVNIIIRGKQSGREWGLTVSSDDTDFEISEVNTRDVIVELDEQGENNGN